MSAGWAAKYRGLLEAAPDAMVVVDEAGNIALLNVHAEKQFGYDHGELVGQPFDRIIPEGFAQRLEADRSRTAAEAQAQEIGTGIELSARRKDGSLFPVEMMLSPMRSEDVTLVTAAIRDITKRRAVEEQLLQTVAELNRSNEELRHFADIASHDLQEPLRMVASYTQLLATRYKGRLDADADEFIGFAVDGVHRMQRLIKDLLAFSRVGTNGTLLESSSSEDAVVQAIANLQGAIDESGSVITMGSLPAVMADEGQLIQVFQNLIGNAIKYKGTESPRIRVSSSHGDDGMVTFSVCDNGLGIESRYFEKIFGMFQRLHRRQDFAGTGIGLAICKKIIERHGGCMAVRSEVGVGSTFSFTLAAGEEKV